MVMMTMVKMFVMMILFFVDDGSMRMYAHRPFKAFQLYRSLAASENVKRKRRLASHYRNDERSPAFFHFRPGTVGTRHSTLRARIRRRGWKSLDTMLQTFGRATRARATGSFFRYVVLGIQHRQGSERTYPM